jgi:membrane protein implicated in regulation of membrane protease activity
MATDCSRERGKKPELRGKHGRISRRVVVRYVVLQVPGLVAFVAVLLVIRHWVEFPSWVPWAGAAIWLVKDAALFPLVWRSYDPERPPHGHSMLGERAVALGPMAPAGLVRVRGELWGARIAPDGTTVGEGETVTVVGQEGLTLLVQPEQSMSSDPQRDPGMGA